MASEVISDIKIELSDLNNLCCHASLASKCLHEMIKTYATQEIYHPLTCVATPQVKIGRIHCSSWIWNQYLRLAFMHEIRNLNCDSRPETYPEIVITPRTWNYDS